MASSTRRGIRALRFLTLIQVFLLAFAMVAPIPAAADEPSDSPPPSSQPSESAQPADPTAEPTVEPTVNPTPAPSPAGTSDWIVTFAPGTSAGVQAAALVAAGAQLLDSIPVLRMSVVRITDGTTTLADLRADGAVSRVDADRVRAAEAAPSDTSYDDQWSLARIGWDDVWGSLNFCVMPDIT